MRIRRLIYLLLALAIAAGAFRLLWPTDDSPWTDQQLLPVNVQVIDTDAMRPVAGASVTIFRGGATPMGDVDITNLPKTAFSPEADDALPQTAVTDAKGCCSFDYPFSSQGRSSSSILGRLLERPARLRGSISTAGALAAGYSRGPANGARAAGRPVRPGARHQRSEPDLGDRRA
jgi:hypothetical protein